MSGIATKLGREVSWMTPHDLHISLTGTGAPSGQIDFDSLSSIASSMQELVTRVGRVVAGQEGPGRTTANAARAVRLRLTGLRPGSTVLDVALGHADVLPMDVEGQGEIADRVWEVIEGIPAGQRPSWVTPPIAQSALRVIDAFARAAAQVELVRGDGRSATWRRASAPRAPWVERSRTGHAAVSVSGRLEKVDLKDGSFRIRDDVGNGINLISVVDADVVAGLVGTRAVATGIASYDAAGQLMSLSDPTIARDSWGQEWTAQPPTDLDQLLAAAPGPDIGGIDGISDGDVDAFLALLRQ